MDIVLHAISKKLFILEIINPSYKTSKKNWRSPNSRPESAKFSSSGRLMGRSKSAIRSQIWNRRTRKSVSPATKRSVCWVSNVNAVSCTVTAIGYQRSINAGLTINNSSKRDFKLSWLKSNIVRFKKSDLRTNKNANGVISRLHGLTWWE